MRAKHLLSVNDDKKRVLISKNWLYSGWENKNWHKFADEKPFDFYHSKVARLIPFLFDNFNHLNWLNIEILNCKHRKLNVVFPTPFILFHLSSWNVLFCYIYSQSIQYLIKWFDLRQRRIRIVKCHTNSTIDFKCVQSVMPWYFLSDSQKHILKLGSKFLPWNGRNWNI